MTSPGSGWGRFELPPVEAARLARRQVVWVAVQALATAALLYAALSPPLTLGLATGLGLAATRPARAHVLPLVVVAVTVLTLLLTEVGLPAPLAAGAAAGLAVALGEPSVGGHLARVEAVLAGFAGAGLGAWLAAQLPLTGLSAALASGACTAALTAQALLPPALSFRARSRVPSPGTIRATLGEAWRPPTLRAWQLDQEIQRATPDRDLREGLGEVAGWVYRLALTLQALDADVARIDPAELAARRAALDATPADDAFVAERRQGTARHLDRMLAHRDTLQTERARTAALQDYALAYLEEARAGLAVARVHPGEETPERLDVVLEKLRAHAAERGARRLAGREVERVG